MEVEDAGIEGGGREEGIEIPEDFESFFLGDFVFLCFGAACHWEGMQREGQGRFGIQDEAEEVLFGEAHFARGGGIAFAGVVELLALEDEGGRRGVLRMESREIGGEEADIRSEMKTGLTGTTTLVASTGICRTHGLLHSYATRGEYIRDAAPALPEHGAYCRRGRRVCNTL